jgi:biuret amidohydrolase
MDRIRGSRIIEGRAALLVIDAQTDFLRPDAPVPCMNADATIAVIRQLIDLCHRIDVPVIFTRETHRPSGVDFEWDGTPVNPAGGVAPHAVEGTPGAEIDGRIAPGSRDHVLVPKRRYDAFLGTDLEIVLNGLGVYPNNTLIITGFATNVCVLYTAASAHQQDYWIRVVPEAVSATTQDLHEAALKLMDHLQAHSLVPLETIVQALEDYAGVQQPQAV